MPDDAFQKAAAGMPTSINRHPAQTPYHVVIDINVSMPAALVHQRGQTIVAAVNQGPCEGGRSEQGEAH